MAQNDSRNSSGATPNSIDAIRNILFGEKEKYFEERLNALQKLIENVQAQLEKQISDLSQRLDKEKEQLQNWIEQLKQLQEKAGKEFQQELEKLRTALEKRLAELDYTKSDRFTLGQQLRQLADFLEKSSE